MSRWSEGGLWPTPRQELLLCAALADGAEAIQAWKSWSADAGADRHALDPGSERLLPGAYRNLTRLGLPREELPDLRARYRQSWFRNQRIAAGARRVIETLARAQIPAIVLKGISLSLRCYRDMGARPMQDADVLVPFERAASAVSALVGEGWSQDRPGALRHHNHRAATLRHAAGHNVDLHWLAFGPEHQAMPEDDLWARRVPLDVCGTPAWALCSTDELIHTLVHGVLWNPLPPVRWVADAALILRNRREPVDWALLVQSVCRRRLVPPVRDGLRWLREHLRAEIPDAVLERLADERVRPVERLEYWLQQKPLPRLALYPFRYRRAARLAGVRPGPIGFLRFVGYALSLEGARSAPAVLRNKLRDWL
jgi:hypothetical protein